MFISRIYFYFSPLITLFINSTIEIYFLFLDMSQGNNQVLIDEAERDIWSLSLLKMYFWS